MGFRFAGPIGAPGRPPEIIDAGTTQPVENQVPGITDVLKAAGRASPLAVLGPAGIAAAGLATVGQLYYSRNLDALSEVRNRATALAPAAIAEATGFSDLGKLLNSILYGLLAAMIALAASTALGGAIGGIVGFFFGGAGAAPGAVVGAKAGFEVGLAILTWLGVGFLAASIIGGLGELISLELSAVRRGWAAGDLSGTRRAAEIEAAAQELAKAAGVLIRLILEGILAYLMRGAPMATTRAATGTINQVRTAGSEAVAAETVAELVRNLRKSNLGKGFADWVELNWQKLLENPKLRRYAPETKAPVATGAAGPAQTPSQAFKDANPQPAEPLKPPTEVALTRAEAARLRQAKMLEDNVGFNVSPTSWDKYPSIGRNGTFLTDKQAIADVVGQLPKGQSTMEISANQARALEQAMGLDSGTLNSGFKVREVIGIKDMLPRSPLEGNAQFLGPGQHLPGGGPELVVNSIPTTDTAAVKTIMTILVK